VLEWIFPRENSLIAPQVTRPARAVRTQAVKLAGAPLELMFDLASDAQVQVPTASMRLHVSDLEKVFGDAEVLIAAMSAPDLRYLYVNAGYHGIRAGVPMVGRTYREVFPEAAAAGAEARLHTVIDNRERWIVEDYPTRLPNREVPAWWQGECVPIDVAGTGWPDAVLILLWDVTSRHVPQWGVRARSEESVRIEAGKVKLTARMATLGLTAERGWRISEEIRETDEATWWLLRPIHMRETAPAHLVERVEFARAAA